MSSLSNIHLPTDAIPGAADVPRDGKRPVVLIAFAKLVLLIGTVVFLAPIWLALVGDAASTPPGESWAALRLLVVGGSIGIFAVVVTAVKVWAGLLKVLARAD